MDFSDIKNILLKKQICLKISAISEVYVFSQKLFHPQFHFSRIFSIHQEHLFSGTPKSVCCCCFFFDCNLSNKNLLSLFLYFFKKSDILYLFFTRWLLLIVIDKFAVIEFAILIRSLSLLLPSSTLAEHIYRVSLIPRKGIFQIFTGQLLLLLLF